MIFTEFKTFTFEMRSFAISKESGLMSIKSKLIFLSSNFLKIKGMKLPTPTDGSKIETSSFSTMGRFLIISVINDLFVK